MRSLLGLLTVVLLCLGTTACGDSSSPTTQGSHASTAHKPKRDRDNDGDNNDDDAHILFYGHAASPVDRQALTTLVRRYYAAAAAADGAKACTMLMPFIAESVAESYGHKPGLRGKTCAVVMSKLFKQRHKLLSGESSSLRFVTVRVGNSRALTVLSFAMLPEVRQLVERRDGSTWKVLGLFDGIIE